MTQVLVPLGVLGGLGLLFGIILSVASKMFYVKTDERIDKITEILPGANCGGCGYAGCNAFATAVVEGKAATTGCPVSSDQAKTLIADIMGTQAQPQEKMVAKVLCCGGNDSAVKKYEYYGATDCVTANRLAGGDKACAYSCLGMGSCTTVCKFDAIKMMDGVAVIDKEKCTGCGACIDICPKSVIDLVPKRSRVYVGCSNTDKGNMVNKVCKVGCIACKLCEKACAFDAIKVEDNLAKIDYSKCTNCGACVEKCPRKIIVKEYVKN